MKKATFIVEKTNTGYSAYCENYPVGTTGTTYQELKENMLDGLNMLLEDENLPLATEKDIIIRFDLQQFFEYHNELNILALSEQIGINNSLISQYKSGKKFPSERQTRRILQGIKNYGKKLTAPSNSSTAPATELSTSLNLTLDLTVTEIS